MTLAFQSIDGLFGIGVNGITCGILGWSYIDEHR